ncbi:MAG: NnrU family protein [Alphaproteobacteria bacterium]
MDDPHILLLLAAVAAFVGLHLVLALPAIRARLVARLGTGPFRGLYALQSTVTLVLTALAYRDAPYVPLWTVPALAWLPVVLMPVALWLVVGALSTRNPTAIGGAAAAIPAGDALPLTTAVTRHPMLWGVTLWALGHLAANGDLASLFLFGGMAVLSLAGMAGIDAKKRADPAFDFAALAERTSLLPLAATLAGRNRLRAGWADALRLAVAVLLYVGILHGHASVFGVSPYPPGHDLPASGVTSSQ